MGNCDPYSDSPGPVVVDKPQCTRVEEPTLLCNHLKSIWKCTASSSQNRTMVSAMRWGRGEDANSRIYRGSALVGDRQGNPARSQCAQEVEVCIFFGASTTSRRNVFAVLDPYSHPHVHAHGRPAHCRVTSDRVLSIPSS